MKAYILQHVEFEGPGSILDWFSKQNATVRHCRMYESEPLPSPDQVDFLIIMGGPMSVNDEDIYPWLSEEKSFVRQVITSGTPVLGICLGAQLIASALGSRVYAGPQKEIGWFPVTANKALQGGFRFPATTTVFHWHGETFDLPEGAVKLASSQVCENQAFQAGNNVIGIQFHLEATPETVDRMVEHCHNELVKGEYIQGIETIKQLTTATCDQANALMENVLDYLLKCRT